MSRAIGIIKVIDSLGRIVIPKEMRERLSLGRRRGDIDPRSKDGYSKGEGNEGYVKKTTRVAFSVCIGGGESFPYPASPFIFRKIFLFPLTSGGGFDTMVVTKKQAAKEASL